MSFSFITPVSYWILTVLWLLILWLYLTRLRQKKMVGGAVAVLLTVLAIDAFRTVFESAYFGFYFNSKLGLLPSSIYEVLDQPELLIVPKLVNVFAGLVVLFILVYRWIPREVQEREQWVENLKESEEQFRQVTENINEAFWMTDPEKSQMIYISPAYEKIWGRSRESLYQQPMSFIDAIHEDDRLRVVAAFEKQISGEYDEEYRIQKPDGQIRWIRDRAFPIKNEQGRVYRVTGVAADITDQKRSEAALRASEARLEGILQTAPESIIVIGDDQRIRYFNQGAERIFGYSKDDIIGEPLEVLIPPQYRKTHPELIDKFSQAPEDYHLMSQRGEISGLRKDGTVFPATASVSKLRMDDQLIFMVALRDITEHKKYEADIIASKEEAEIANRSKSEFLANMSHELRTPLNAIIGFSEMLTNEIFGPHGDPKYSEYATDINKSGNHLLRIINDILDISKIEAGKTTVEEIEINVTNSVNDCISMVETRAQEAGVSVAVDMSEHLPALRADERYLKQIMINLLSNSIKFTPNGGQVTVNVGLNDHSGMEITITDTGVGIAAEDIPKVLQAFSQVADSQTRDYGGTGLGLPICNSLMELHGGSMNIESEVGKGTAVTVTFPPERTIQA